jgi:hypothetical protein
MPIARIRSGLDSDEFCVDKDSPFSVMHVGKLQVNRPKEPDMPKEPELPRLHCVAANVGSQALSVVRFTPLDRSQLTGIVYRGRELQEVGAFFQNVEHAAEVFGRHLAKLGELGITPWLKRFDIGISSDLGGIPGIFIEQDMLPDESYAVKMCTPEADMMSTANYQYSAWSRGEPAKLRDLEYFWQYTCLAPGEPVLHDVEPLFEENTAV